MDTPSNYSLTSYREVSGGRFLSCKVSAEGRESDEVVGGLWGSPVLFLPHHPLAFPFAEPLMCPRSEKPAGGGIGREAVREGSGCRAPWPSSQILLVS